MPALVSILIPAYNAERWLGETITSALEQSCPAKEIIVVDDGSTDATLRVARSFACSTLKVVSQENAGAAAARNKALSLAQGHYIQWLDADDVLAPQKILRQLQESERAGDPRILLSSAFATFYYRRHKARFIPTSLWHDLEPVEWFIRKFRDHVFMIPAAWLVTRELTEMIGPWDERLSLDDDGEYFGRMVAACKIVRFVPEARSYYRQANIESLSRMMSHEGCESLFLSHRLCIDYVLGLENSERTRAAALEYMQYALICFFPDERELLQKIEELTATLGGRLSPPALSPKYEAIRKMFGWQAAKRLSAIVPRYKYGAVIMCDRLLALLSQHRDAVRCHTGS